MKRSLIDLFENDETLGLLYEVFEKIQKKFPLQMVNLVNIVADTAKNMWKREAMGTSKWGDKYQQAIAMEPATPNQNARVYIDESVVDERSNKPAVMFVKMTEKGVDPWSIRDALLNSRKAKRTPEGLRYIIVPFPWHTPVKKGGTKLAAKFQGRVLTDKIYKIVKSTYRLPSWTELSKDETYMAGMVRYEKDNHTQYFTFRTVSDDTPEDKWQHKGHAATPVYPVVRERIDSMIKESLHNFLQEFTSEHSNQLY